ncbi:hypothetical protein BaRGS_00021692 [Batillaria attramentaria]|uniref:Uncharacterized protein n=1 Tax=Batillaria attramentaria TaxID=370345 RepID=A0ABD0KIX5_9CAEN
MTLCYSSEAKNLKGGERPRQHGKQTVRVRMSEEAIACCHHQSGGSLQNMAALSVPKISAGLTARACSPSQSEICTLTPSI